MGAGSGPEKRKVEEKSQGKKRETDEKQLTPEELKVAEKESLMLQEKKNCWKKKTQRLQSLLRRRRSRTGRVLQGRWH